jgi:two-component system, cell cycle sensor histidine kinase and response regulator CckA
MQMDRTLKDKVLQLEQAKCKLEQDVAVLRQAHEALRESNDALNALLHSSPLAIIALDPDGNVTQWSPSAERMFGWQEGEALGQALPIVPEDRRDEHHALRQRVLRGESFANVEVRRRKKDGSPIDISLSTAPLRDSRGHVTGVMSVSADITDRKRAERALRESEDRFREASLSITDMAYSCIRHPDGRYVLDWVTGATESLSGYSNDDFLALGCWQKLVLEEDLPLFERNVVGLGPGASGTCELRLRRKDGSLVWAASYSRCVAPTEKPGHVRLYGGLRDITGRKRAEEALRESEDKFRYLFDHSVVGKSLTFPSGEIHVNAAFCRMLGFTSEELKNRRWQDITHPDDIELTERAIETLVSGERDSQRVCKRFLHKSGAVVWTDVSTSLRRDRDGQPLYLMTTVSDVTERVRAESERTRFMTAIEQAAEVIVISDAQGIIEYVNPAFETATGYTRQEVLGQHVDCLKSGQHDDSFYRDMWTTISSGRIWHGRVVNRRKDGTVYTEESTISPVRDAAGAIVNYVAIDRDVTEELRSRDEKAFLEEQLRQAQRVESIGRLAGGVAHDFNNMLGVILGYGETILQELHQGDPLRNDVAQIVEAGRRSAALTRQLLAFSRRQTLQLEVLNPNAVVKNVEKMLRRLIGEDIELILSSSEDVALVKADAGQLEQVIMNLAVNARDAMPQGGTLIVETANVELDSQYCELHVDVVPGRYVMLAVSDTGCGMDRQTMAQIFEPFFTTKEKGKGTGLGLATVYGIIKQLGGSILVSSEPRQGTTFKIYLPQTLAEPVMKQAQPEEEGRQGSGRHVLVVEDEGALRGLIVAILSRQDFHVTASANSGEALLLVEEKGLRPDLVITDVVMPGMSGSVLVERLRRTQPGLKVLYMSGYADNAVVPHGILEQGTPLIQKPFNRSDLSAKVQEILRRGE